MGDVRFDASLRAVRQAASEPQPQPIPPETGVEALAALAADTDPVLANVLATRLLNQFRRSATLLEFAGDGVIALDGDGRILFANPAAGRLLGWETRALLGRDFHSTTGHHKEGHDAMDREECEILGALRQNAKIVRVNDHDVFLRKDGSSFLVGFVAAPILYQNEPTGLAVVFRDITTEKTRESDLALSATALDAVPVPVLWVGRDGNFLYANAAAAKHFRYDRRALLGMSVFDVDLDLPPEGWDAHWLSVRRTGSASFPSHHRTREGDVRLVTVRVQHVERGGHEFHVAVVETRPPAPTPDRS